MYKKLMNAWELRKLENIVKIFDGTHKTPHYTETGIKFVSVENIKTLDTEKYISEEAFEKEYSKKKAKSGDILMTRIGDIGTVNVIRKKEPLAYYVTLALLKPIGIDSDFLAGIISSSVVQKELWRRTLHIAFPKKINLGEIGQVQLYTPTESEQQKIGSFFKHLDELITLHQRREKISNNIKNWNSYEYLLDHSL